MEEWTAAHAPQGHRAPRIKDPPVFPAVVQAGAEARKRGRRDDPDRGQRILLFLFHVLDNGGHWNGSVAFPLASFLTIACVLSPNEKIPRGHIVTQSVLER